MNKTFMGVLTAVIALVPTIAGAAVPPTRVPEPATALLLLAVAGVGAAVTRLTRRP